MLPFVTIRQDVLQNWQGKIDFADAAIIALMRSMDLRNPKVKKLAHRGYVRLSRKYIASMLPLLDVSEDRIGRRLKTLKNIGLIDLLQRVDPATHQYRLYVRLSKLYWAAEERANSDTEKKKELAVGENTHGCSDRTPTGENTHISIKDNQRLDPAAAPSGATEAPPAAAGNEGFVPEEEVRAFWRDLDRRNREFRCN